MLLLITDDFNIFLKSYMRSTLLEEQDLSSMSKISLTRMKNLIHKKNCLPTLKEVSQLQNSLNLPKTKTYEAYFSSVLLNYNIFNKVHLIDNQEAAAIFKNLVSKKGKQKESLLSDEFKTPIFNDPLLFKDIIKVREPLTKKVKLQKRISQLKKGGLPTPEEIPQLFPDKTYDHLIVEFICFFNSILKKEKLDYRVEHVSKSAYIDFLNKLYP